MIHWKVSVLPIAIGALAAVGFVWLRRFPLRRPRVAPVLESLDPDAAARADALRDFSHRPPAEEGSDDGEFAFVEPVEGESELRPLPEEAVSEDEPYDALDPESMGSEFLRRAVGSPSSGLDEQPPAPVDYADAAEELPVGAVDAQGNTELHPPTHPSKRRVELPPTDDDLAQRAALDTAPSSDEGSGKPNA